MFARKLEEDSHVLDYIDDEKKIVEIERGHTETLEITEIGIE